MSRWNVAAAITGWVVPGLGHMLLGQKGRGLIIAAGIGLMWVGGLLIGGVGVIDREQHPVWFFGQLLVGPSIAVDFFRPYLDYQPALARVHEQGMLYVAMAGLLNLLAMIDVLYRDPADPRHRDARTGAKAGTVREGE